MSLVDSLERAAEALPGDADSIYPANGDPSQLLNLLDTAAAGRVLEWLLGNAPDAADELAAAWLEEPAGANAVAGLSEAGLPKAGKKVLRRALHRARSRGIEISQTAPAAPKVARLPAVDEKIDAGYVSPFDPRGSRLVYLVESRAAGGARVSEALLDLQRGIVDFQVYQAGRRQVRDFIRDVTHRERMKSVEVEPSAVRALIARHAALHPEGEPLPRAFNESRSQVLKDADSARTPGELAREALGEGHDEAGMEALLACLEEREIGPWPPPHEQLNELVLAVRDEALEVREDKGEAEALSHLETRLRETVEAQYHTELAAEIAERFDELAYVYWQSARESLARACLSTADDFRGDPANNPVAKALCKLLGDALIADVRPQIEQQEAAEDDSTEASEADSGPKES